MDSTLSFLPPGSCHTIQPTAILTPSILPLLASGSSLQTVAGAPLAPDLLALPQDVPGYSAVLGFSLFGVGNNVSERGLGAQLPGVCGPDLSLLHGCTA